MRGRKPTPTALKIVKGNPGKRPINQNEPQPELGIGDPPKSMKGEALKEWRRLGPQLERMGVLTEVDWPAFVAYCTAWARYVNAEAEVEKMGEVVKSPNGHPIQNPFRATANRAYEQCKAFWSEYGMTASSRSRIQVKPRRGKSAADLRKDRFFGGISGRNA